MLMTFYIYFLFTYFLINYHVKGTLQGVAFYVIHTDWKSELCAAFLSNANKYNNLVKTYLKGQRKAIHLDKHT